MAYEEEEGQALKVFISPSLEGNGDEMKWKDYVKMFYRPELRGPITDRYGNDLDCLCCGSRGLSKSSEPIHAEEECSYGEPHEVTLRVCKACIHLCGVNPYLDSTWHSCQLMYRSGTLQRIYSPTTIALALHRPVTNATRTKWLED